MKKFIITALAISSVSCVKYEPVKDAVISPGNDQLQRLLFDKLIRESNIDYTINESGYYISQKENLDLMQSLAEQASEMVSETNRMELGSEWLVKIISGNLNGVIYHVIREESKFFIRSTSEIFTENHIFEHVVRAKEVCTKNA